ncbi:uncharacterized protein LOC105203524 [Solenopsis invicta]|uniref:uncharacterized protein LOC105203524 n=1 Tax=Solenopsis invicta TaxID=13686 RepID=UPI00193DDE6D|nr:uncharacterized protein LOC105203524 [Solenopsis invicta]
MDTSNRQLKCGHCTWQLNSHCQNLWEHQCFADFNETKDLLNVDQNSIVTIVRNGNTMHQEQPQPSTSAHNDIDELLIMAVMERPALFDHRIDIRERSKLKKNAL